MAEGEINQQIACALHWIKYLQTQRYAFGTNEFSVAF